MAQLRVFCITMNCCKKHCMKLKKATMIMLQKLMGFSLERNHLIHILALILPYFFLPKNSISTNLQAKDITIQEATSGTNLLVSHLNSL